MPNPATFTGAILEDLGYITPDQRKKAEFLDSEAGKLAAADPTFKKPQFGHIANGEIDSILAEYAKQHGKNPLPQGEFAKTELGLKGEAGNDIEREGGPIRDMLKLQKELRMREERGEKLPDDPARAADRVREVAKELGLHFPSDGRQSTTSPADGPERKAADAEGAKLGAGLEKINQDGGASIDLGVAHLPGATNGIEGRKGFAMDADRLVRTAVNSEPRVGPQIHEGNDRGAPTHHPIA